ncbi:MAG: hypothetical protein J5528_05600 [Firmicutes bacterium]|nr:hypothetical protein [Bacillota bacterium]
MEYNFLSITEQILQIGVLTFIFVRSLLLIKRGYNTVIPVFFCFGMLGFLISDIYWIVHTVMFPGKRIPFAVNLMGENAVFLLCATVLMIVVGKERMKPGIETLITGIFAAVITGLWIAWSGEWLKDIICGIVYGYFLTAVVRAVKAEEVMSKKARHWAAVFSLLFVAMMVVQLLIPRPSSIYLEKAYYFVAFAGLIFCIVRTVLAFKDKKNSNYLIAVSFLSFAWATNTMYVSASPVYEFASIVCSITMPFMLFAVERKAEES